MAELTANGNIKTNREYKDRLFRFIFGSPENKRYLLSLYNALNGTEYQNEEEIEITTLNDVIYIKMKNDVSFLLGSELSLYEHQSTYNPNMPLRGLMYFSDLYRQLLSKKRTDLFSKTKVMIPTPKYYVFYNGDENHADMEELRLSSSFEKEDLSGVFEWTATLININKGRNQEIMDKCLALRQYSDFVSKVKEYGKEMPIEEAIDKAVEDAIKGNYLNGFFRKHKEGVVDMSLTEFNEEEFVANRRAEGRAEVIINMLKMRVPLADIAKYTNLSVEEIEKIEKSVFVTK